VRRCFALAHDGGEGLLACSPTLRPTMPPHPLERARLLAMSSPIRRRRGLRALDAGLVDMLTPHLAPVVLGAGTPLFTGGAPLFTAELRARWIARKPRTAVPSKIQ
jgi:hypothetical protein